MTKIIIILIASLFCLLIYKSNGQVKCPDGVCNRPDRACPHLKCGPDEREVKNATDCGCCSLCNTIKSNCLIVQLFNCSIVNFH